jgi:hypothetical protein
MRQSILAPTNCCFNKHHDHGRRILLWRSLHLRNSAYPSNTYMLPDIRSDSVEEGNIDFLPDGILDIHVTEGYLGSPPTP